MSLHPLTRRELLAGAAVAAIPGQEKPQSRLFDPTDRYSTKRVLGWSVRVHKAFEREEKTLCAETLRLLEFQLYQVTRVIPAPALERLRRVWIWVELREGHHPCMAYHPDAGWLRENGMNPDKAKCVELADARNFLTWTLQQPWMVLHELAHAYHDQVLGFDHAGLVAAHKAAVAGGRYEKVLRWNGSTVKHYALNDPMEYFAEATEAYFGANDYYPFVRPELKSHDPEAYRLVEEEWGVRSGGVRSGG